MPDALLPFLPEQFDAAAFPSDTTPPPRCGHYWSGEIQAGLLDLAELPPENLLTLWYHDLLVRPAEMVEHFFDFVLGKK